jgi:tetratricopeptide (TPR) repeat protein
VLILLGVTPARADDADVAREHYRQGTKLYDLRRYREAAHEYELAYENKEDPALLFNIAQAYRFAGDYEAAIASYRSFLRHVPHLTNRGEVEKRIAEMQELLNAQRKQQNAPPEGMLGPENPKPEPPKPEPAKPEPAKPEPAKPELVKPVPEVSRGRTEKIAGISLVAVGIASFAVGAGFAVLATQASDQISHAKQDQPFDPSIEKRGKTDQGVAIGMFAVGGAAVVTGVTLWLLGRHHAHKNSFVRADGSVAF